MSDKDRIVKYLIDIINEPKIYNNILDAFIKLYNENYESRGKLMFIKDLKDEAVCDLKNTKQVFDIFCYLDIVYSVVVDGFNIEFHIRHIKKEYFNLSDISYMVHHDIKYFTYQKMHRKEKLKKIFGTELE
jgi:hypothetical protein